MVYVWTGLTQALGLKYYSIPGIDIPPETGFQYLEPTEDNAFMKADEYDELIDDPTTFLYTKWLPRISNDIGTENSYRSNLALVKGSMAMLQYFNDFGPQVAKLKSECGTVSAIAGIFNAPIAGIVFTLEVLMLDLTMAFLIPLLSVNSLVLSLMAYF